MRVSLLNALVTMASLFTIGCGANPASGPFGAPHASMLMTPFAGNWRFEFEQSLAAQKAAGISEEQIAQIRKFYADNPALGKMHADITIDGNVAVGAGPLSSEYRFFGMHKHGSTVCGKAWHHEDRFDPGDMSKCYVRLEIMDGKLYMQVNMQDGLPALNDPDLTSEPLVEIDASQCEVDAMAGNQPGDWVVYVFSRRQ